MVTSHNRPVADLETVFIERSRRQPAASPGKLIVTANDTLVYRDPCHAKDSLRQSHIPPLPVNFKLTPCGSSAVFMDYIPNGTGAK